MLSEHFDGQERRRLILQQRSLSEIRLMSAPGLLRIILTAPEACILRTQIREGTMRFCRTFGEPWRGSASLAACGPPLSYLPMQPALLFAATLLPLLARSNTVGTSLQTPDRFNLDRIGS